MTDRPNGSNVNILKFVAGAAISICIFQAGLIIGQNNDRVGKAELQAALKPLEQQDVEFRNGAIDREARLRILERTAAEVTVKLQTIEDLLKGKVAAK